MFPPGIVDAATYERVNENLKAAHRRAYEAIKAGPGDFPVGSCVAMGDWWAPAGADDALAILDTFAEYVATGFAGLANIFDPEAIVISGGLVNVGDVLLSRLRERFPVHLEGRAYRPEIPIVAATLGDQAGVIGAAVLARQVAASS